jgi:hypothetical protein
MIPPILHQIWLGSSPLPPAAQRWQEGVRRLHPHWDYRLWTDRDLVNLPGAHLLKRCQSQSSRANVLRLAVVLKHGGVYLDSDCEVLRPLDPLLAEEAFAALELPDRLCNAVFGAAPGHPWVQWQFDHLADYVDRPAPWGPPLMSAAPRNGLTIVPTRWFYPFLWDAPVEQRRPAADSFLLHHWNMSWKPEARRRHPEPDVHLHSYHADYERLLRRLRPGKVVEWGPGLNTELALAVGAETFSIEHQLAYLPKHPRPGQSVLFAPIDSSRYFLFPDDADLYFIDGRNRARCLEAVHERCRRKAVVCLHDAQRQAYREALMRFRHVLEPSWGFAVATKDKSQAKVLAEIFGKA